MRLVARRHLSHADITYEPGDPIDVDYAPVVFGRPRPLDAAALVHRGEACDQEATERCPGCDCGRPAPDPPAPETAARPRRRR